MGEKADEVEPGTDIQDLVTNDVYEDLVRLCGLNACLCLFGAGSRVKALGHNHRQALTLTQPCKQHSIDFCLYLGCL